MPRPSITMVIHRPSRSSRLAEETGSSLSPASTSASQPPAPSPSKTVTRSQRNAEFSPSSSVQSESASEKRVRKPSQRLLEAQPAGKGRRSQGEVSLKKEETAAGGEKKGASSQGKRKGRDDEVVDGEFQADELEELADHPSPPKKPKASSRNTEPLSPPLRRSSTRHRPKEEAPVPSAGGTAPEEDKTRPPVSMKFRLVPRPSVDHMKAQGDAASTSPASAVISTVISSAVDDPTQMPGGSKTKKKSKKEAAAAKKAKKAISTDQPLIDTEEPSEPHPEQEEPISVAMTEPPVPPVTTEAAGAGERESDRRLTARQRAKLYGAEEHLIKLEDPRPKTPPPDYQEKREERNKKRREQAAQKREHLKKETLKKLLHKSATSKKAAREEEQKRKQMIRYTINAHGASIMYPEVCNPAHFMQPMPSIPSPLVKFCAVKGCGRPKKYACSKTGVPLCSLQCYKANLALSSLA